MLSAFDLISDISNVETIAVGTKIRELRVPEKRFGEGRWRKLKGHTTVRLLNGKIRLAESHWDEVHGIGRRKLNIKRFLD